MAYTFSRPDAHCHFRSWQGAALGWSGRRSPARRCRLDSAGGEALAWREPDGKFCVVRMGDGTDLSAGRAGTGAVRVAVWQYANEIDDIVAGKAGFQKADLMDYGSLYWHGLLFRGGL